MTQKENIKALFLNRPNEWITLPEIMVYAAQYGTRVKELRESGMHIENKIAMCGNVKHSWYRYVPEMHLMGV